MITTGVLGMPVSDEANALLARDPMALLTAMVLDQQIPLERAFSAPLDLAERLGHQPSAAELATFNPGQLAEVFGRKPALHRFPRSMAGRVQQLAALIVAEYDGDPARIWTTAATGAELAKRIGALPGFGKQKAKIFLALLGKRFGVQPDGWQPACAPFGDPGTRLSVADITDEHSLSQVRAHKQSLKAAASGTAAKLTRICRYKAGLMRLVMSTGGRRTSGRGTGPRDVKRTPGLDNIPEWGGGGHGQRAPPLWDFCYWY